MFPDPAFCQPNERAPERNLRWPVSVKPALAAVFVAWMLSLVRLVLAFVRAELSTDTLLALVFFCSLPMLGVALWLGERRTGPPRRSARAVAHAPSGSAVRPKRLRLVRTTSATRRHGSRPDPNGTRAA